MIQKTINNIKLKAKELWRKARIKLIKVLGGYVCPPVAPEIKAERFEIVNVSASLMVNKHRYDTEKGYRVYIREELARILASHMLDQGVLTSESVVEFNDTESVVKVSARLVKGGQ